MPTPSASILPAPPRNTSGALCLRGFPEPELTAASDWLRHKGYRVVRSLEVAQMIVAGPRAESTLVEQARRRGIRLVPWDRFRTDLGLDQAAGTDNGHAIPLQAQEVRPLLEKGEGWVRILDMRFSTASWAPEDQRLVPDASRFSHVCLDQPFIDTLRAVCLGVHLRMPVALEGETSASKTTAVLWAAHVLNRPVLRLNLNGQTDTGELIGRYVPGNATDELDMNTLREHGDLLNDKTSAILQRASAQGRGLSRLEQYAVAAHESLPATSWRFQEGYLPVALRRGWWLLLDEMNLAEPQILERLNCVLENPPSLVLTEGDGTVFGPGGDVPVAGLFRIFATLNPAEYAGRSVLSPAFRDRWSVWHHAHTATEGDYLAMLRFAVFGEQPIVHFEGTAYQADSATPAYPELQQLPEVESLLQRIALFHVSVAKAAGGDGAAPGLGRTRRERYTFTRRTVLNVLHLMRAGLLKGDPVTSAALVREALRTFYVARLRDSGDRNAVNSLLRAAGLG